MTKNAAKFGEIGERIFLFFVEKGIKPVEVTRDTGLSASTLSEVKNGVHNATLPLLQYVADLGADMTWIMTGRPAAAGRVDDSALRLVMRDWADLSDDDRVRLSGEVRQLAAEARAKKGEAVSG